MSVIAYISNATRNSGVGHRAFAIQREIQANTTAELAQYEMDGKEGVLLKDQTSLVKLHAWKGALGSKTMNWIRLGGSLKKDILRSRCDLVHATNQTLSFIRSKKVPFIVTVHDIIEIIEPQSIFGGLVARYLYKGIKKADHIIAVSEFTAKMVMDYYGLKRDRITVIPNGVGKEFHPINDFEQTVACSLWRQKLRLSAESKIILYVGSEHPRKNVTVALEAFAKLAREMNDVIFIKVGDPGFAAGREALLNAIDRFNVKDEVRILPNVDDSELNELYNLADVLIYPSTFEGFGLPPLQAMACGTPVVCSSATSLPEVVGEAAVLLNPSDVDGFAKALSLILLDHAKAGELRDKGIERAKGFSWQAAAVAEVEVYKKILAKAV